jgi:hypothetical protein
VIANHKPIETSTVFVGFVYGFYCGCAWLFEDKIADNEHIE